MEIVTKIEPKNDPEGQLLIAPMRYLLDLLKIWQIFIPSRLELLKTHHCGLHCWHQFVFNSVVFLNQTCSQNYFLPLGM